MSRTDPAQTFLAVQQAAGVIAAKHRGDLAGAEELLAAIGTETARTRGFYLLAELALTLQCAQTGQSMDELARELSLHIAAAGLPPYPAVDRD